MFATGPTSSSTTRESSGQNNDNDTTRVSSTHIIVTPDTTFPTFQLSNTLHSTVPQQTIDKRTSYSALEERKRIRAKRKQFNNYQQQEGQSTEEPTYPPVNKSSSSSYYQNYNDTIQRPIQPPTRSVITEEEMNKDLATFKRQIKKEKREKQRVSKKKENNFNPLESNITIDNNSESNDKASSSVASTSSSNVTASNIYDRKQRNKKEKKPNDFRRVKNYFPPVPEGQQLNVQGPRLIESQPESLSATTNKPSTRIRENKRVNSQAIQNNSIESSVTLPVEKLPKAKTKKENQLLPQIGQIKLNNEQHTNTKPKAMDSLPIHEFSSSIINSIEENQVTVITGFTEGCLTQIIMGMHSSSTSSYENFHNEFSHIVLDEIHERKVDTDLLLYFVREIVKVNPKIRIILMSATLSQEKICKYFESYLNMDISSAKNNGQNNGGNGEDDELFVSNIEKKVPAIHIPSGCYPVTENHIEDVITLLYNPVSNPLPEEELLSKQQFAPLLSKPLRASIKPERRILGARLIEYLHVRYPLNQSILVFLPGMMEIEDFADDLTANFIGGASAVDCPYDIHILHSLIAEQEQEESLLPPKEVLQILMFNGAYVDDPTQFKGLPKNYKTPSEVLQKCLDPPNQSLLEQAYYQLESLGAIVNHQLGNSQTDSNSVVNQYELDEAYLVTSIGKFFSLIPTELNAAYLLLIGYSLNLLPECIIIVSILSRSVPILAFSSLKLLSARAIYSFDNGSESDLIAGFNAYNRFKQLQTLRRDHKITPSQFNSQLAKEMLALKKMIEIDSLVLQISQSLYRAYGIFIENLTPHAIKHSRQEIKPIQYSTDKVLSTEKMNIIKALIATLYYEQSVKGALKKEHKSLKEIECSLQIKDQALSLTNSDEMQKVFSELFHKFDGGVVDCTKIKFQSDKKINLAYNLPVSDSSFVLPLTEAQKKDPLFPIKLLQRMIKGSSQESKEKKNQTLDYTQVRQSLLSVRDDDQIFGIFRGLPGELIKSHGLKFKAMSSAFDRKISFIHPQSDAMRKQRIIISRDSVSHPWVDLTIPEKILVSGSVSIKDMTMLLDKNTTLPDIEFFYEMSLVLFLPLIYPRRFCLFKPKYGDQTFCLISELFEKMKPHEKTEYVQNKINLDLNAIYLISSGVKNFDLVLQILRSSIQKKITELLANQPVVDVGLLSVQITDLLNNAKNYLSHKGYNRNIAKIISVLPAEDEAVGGDDESCGDHILRTSSFQRISQRILNLLSKQCLLSPDDPPVEIKKKGKTTIEISCSYDYQYLQAKYLLLREINNDYAVFAHPKQAFVCLEVEKNNLKDFLSSMVYFSSYEDKSGKNREFYTINRIPATKRLNISIDEGKEGNNVRKSFNTKMKSDKLTNGGFLLQPFTRSISADAFREKIPANSSNDEYMQVYAYFGKQVFYQAKAGATKIHSQQKGVTFESLRKMKIGNDNDVKTLFLHFIDARRQPDSSLISNFLLSKKAENKESVFSNNHYFKRILVDKNPVLGKQKEYISLNIVDMDKKERFTILLYLDREQTYKDENTDLVKCSMQSWRRSDTKLIYLDFVSPILVQPNDNAETISNKNENTLDVRFSKVTHSRTIKEGFRDLIPASIQELESRLWYNESDFTLYYCYEKDDSILFANLNDLNLSFGSTLENDELCKLRAETPLARLSIDSIHYDIKENLHFNDIKIQFKNRTDISHPTQRKSFTTLRVCSHQLQGALATSNNIYVLLDSDDHQQQLSTSPTSIINILNNSSNNTTINSNIANNNNKDVFIQREFPIQEIPIYNISRIPADSQIISISAFNSNYDKSKLVLGVTFTQPINTSINTSLDNSEQKRKYIDDDENRDEDQYSSSYDSGGGGDSTDEDSEMNTIHSKKKKKKVNTSGGGSSFVSHSKMNENEENEQQNQQNQQFNNYFYIYLLDIDEIVNNHNNIKYNSLLYSSNINTQNQTKHKCIQTFSLGYVPLKLSTQTTTLYPNLQKYSIFVICGSDKNFHCFSDIILTPQNNSILLKLFDLPLYTRNNEYASNIRHYYNRFNENLFIEYDFIIPGGVPGSVIDFDSNNNLLVMGCQNGFVKICKGANLELQFMLNSPISSVKILNYTPTELSLLVGESVGRVVLYNVPLTSFVKDNNNQMVPSTPSIINNTNEIMTNIQSTVIYSDEFGDSITCLYAQPYRCGITDIYIGTYNRKLIVYQFESNTCIYKCTYHFEYPIQYIDSLDINNDGVKEIIICTMFEIQILQPDLTSIANYIKEKLKLNNATLPTETTNHHQSITTTLE
ncbi:predicted protein [Naegleria gruberi]|uniref:Predicted protein n=1 Tax=Naegleria gruberi TaxID=5762 RepID=D2UZC0_NAEGR|nr:uncharacterized protein NAEGRDRAFT_45438 [Naegleria gruberi]EFC49921.1 predicted protein [Naegleria gruberi]|eukprot:XP_002682665.1 predicted protein [Naegleria gruberi strain NEG-M]